MCIFFVFWKTSSYPDFFAELPCTQTPLQNYLVAELPCTQTSLQNFLVAELPFTQTSLQNLLIAELPRSQTSLQNILVAELPRCRTSLYPDFFAELLAFYCSVIRSVLEFSCQLFHRRLPKYLSDDIECNQKRAMRIIFPSLSYCEAKDQAGIPTLSEWRESLSIKSVTPKISRIGRQKRNNRFLLIL